jgi:drug/metabolite transporter (DMT)-like permease
MRTGAWRKGMYYLIPSGIYFFANHLMFFSLSAMDVPTYQILMQTRIIFTGLLFTFVLHRPLSLVKWLALFVLFAGVCLKFFKWPLQVGLYGGALVFSQAILGSFASVYNEYLFKKDMQANIFEQNLYSYLFGTFLNLVYLMYFNINDLSKIHLYPSPAFYAVIINGIVIGITTSLILKYVNSIVKSILSVLQIFLVAVCAMLVFSTPMTSQDWLASSVVVLALVLYNSSTLFPNGLLSRTDKVALEEKKDLEVGGGGADDGGGGVTAGEPENGVESKKL